MNLRPQVRRRCGLRLYVVYSCFCHVCWNYFVKLIWSYAAGDAAFAKYVVTGFAQFLQNRFVAILSERKASGTSVMIPQSHEWTICRKFGRY